MTTLSATRSPYRVLSARATVVTVTLLVALAGLAWWATVARARDMRGMAMDDMPVVDGIASVGGMTMDLGAGVFLAMWVTMMVAMMFPTIAPIVLLHRMVMRRAGAGPGRTVSFVAGYLLVWAAVGVVPLALLLAFRSASAGAAWVAPTAGVVLVVAGAYQFTPLKRACQRACQSPITFLSTHDFGQGLDGTLRAGAMHGLYCLGCCWALMGVLFTVGLMNLAWMAAISLVFLAEKNWRHGLALSRVAGVAVAVLGLVVLVRPEVLTAVS